MSTTRLRGARAVAVVLLLAAAGCSGAAGDDGPGAAPAGDDRPSTAPATPPVTTTPSAAADRDVQAHLLRAESSYGRHAAVRGKVDVRIANDGDQPVDVATWQVRHPSFEVVPPAARPTSLVPDGQRRIVPVPFGRPLCEAAPGAADGPVVVLTLEGSGRELVLPLPDTSAGLGRAHDVACRAAAVSATADLALSPGVVQGTGPDATLRTDLVVTRNGPGALEVVQVRGSILLAVTTPATTPLASLRDGTAQVTVPLTLRASRCDAHALIESKTSFTLPVFAALDGAEPAAVQVTAEGPAREGMQALLDTSCGSALPAG